MFKIFWIILKYDLQVMIRNKKEWLHPIAFFIIIISLFAISLSFDETLLKKVSPAIIWVIFLLTSLFSVETLFRYEQEEGTLEQLRLSPYPLWWLMLAKSFALWIISCLPLIITTPFLGLIMHLSGREIIILSFTLMLGSPALTCMGMIGAALTVSLPRSSVFLGLLLFPLYLPILILGESAITSLFFTQEIALQLALLAAISTLTITLGPHAGAFALKISMD